jgi:ParB-like chromosome segregation protein Spo0J
MRRTKQENNGTGRGSVCPAKATMNIDIQIELWPIERLIPRANTPRTHSREQVANIAASIREFGFTNPILVGADDDIIAGHARLPPRSSP